VGLIGFLVKIVKENLSPVVTPSKKKVKKPTFKFVYDQSLNKYYREHGELTSNY
jgi:hypothetical protein